MTIVAAHTVRSPSNKSFTRLYQLHSFVKVEQLAENPRILIRKKSIIMHFITTVVSTFAIVASCTAIPTSIKRDGSSNDPASLFIDKLRDIDNAIIANYNLLNTCTPGANDSIPKAITWRDSMQNISNAITSADVYVSYTSPTFDDAQSQAIGAALGGLGYDLYTWLNFLVSKKDFFDKVVDGKGSVSPQVKADVHDESRGMPFFMTDIKNKLTGSTKDAIDGFKDQVMALYNQTESAFSKAGGQYQLKAVIYQSDFVYELQHASNPNGSVIKVLSCSDPSLVGQYAKAPAVNGKAITFVSSANDAARFELRGDQLNLLGQNTTSNVYAGSPTYAPFSGDVSTNQGNHAWGVLFDPNALNQQIQWSINADKSLSASYYAAGPDGGRTGPTFTAKMLLICGANPNFLLISEGFLEGWGCQNVTLGLTTV